MANYNIPWNKGKTGIYSIETLKKMSEAGKDRPPNRLGKHTEETRRKISEAHKKSGRFKGENNYFYGKHYYGKDNPNYGKHRSEEVKERIRIANIGRHHTKETKDKMSKARKGKKFTKGHIEKIRLAKLGEKNPMYGKLGENAQNWKGGISFEPYAPEFNKQLKELIRQRDGYKCQLCGMPECENIRKLDIHHIDYIKKNCLPDNLIALCNSCNAKVNFNRDYWTEYFNEIILEKVK